MFRAVLNPILRHRTWILLGLTLLLVTCVRLRLLNTPLERDEGEYAYAGQLLLQGVPPYKLAYNMKLPGTYAAFAAIMAVFGQSPGGIHLGLLLVNLASIVLIYLVGRKLLDENAGLVAAVTFALLSLSPSVVGLAAHATHFVVLPALAGILLLLRAAPSQSASPATPDRSARARMVIYNPTTLFLSGLLFGLAFLMKQHGIFFALFAFAYVAWTYLEVPILSAPKRRRHSTRSASAAPAAVPQRQSLMAQHLAGAQTIAAVTSEPEDLNVPPFDESGTAIPPHPRPSRRRFGPASNPSPPRRGESAAAESKFEQPARADRKTMLSALARSCGILLAGILLPYLVTCLLLLASGSFHDFYFWTVTYVRRYVSQYSLLDSADLLSNGLRGAIGANLLFWILPVAGLLFMWWDSRLSRARCIFLILLLICSVCSVSVGFYFRNHYFILLLPVMALLTGTAVSHGLRLLRRNRNIEVLLTVPVVFLFALAVIAALIGNGAYWFEMSPVKVVGSIYQSSLFPEAAKVAAYLKEHTTPDAHVAVMGSEPEIYFLSHRRSSTGFIYMYPLMEQQSYARSMQDQMIAEIERDRPQYIVYVDDRFSWVTQPSSEHALFEWWNRYWPTNLDLELTMPFAEGAEPEINALTDKSSRPPSTLTTNFFYIFKRKN